MSGAYANDRRLRVSGRRYLAEAVFATGIPFLAESTNDDHALFFRVGKYRGGKCRCPSVWVQHWILYVAAGRLTFAGTRTEKLGSLLASC